MLKMQKVFSLPVKNSGSMIEESSGNICAKFNLPNEAKASVSAINHVDALAEALENCADLLSKISFESSDEYQAAIAALAAYRGEV